MFTEIKKDSEFMKPIILIKKDNSEILANSSICLVKGQTGSGKSRLIMNFMVGLSGNDDSLGFEYTPCPPDKCVVYISTEMSKYHLQKRILKVLEQCPPEYETQLRFFDLSTSGEKLKDLKEICALTKPYVLIIDQLGDFVVDINDNKESVEFVKDLNTGIEKHDMAVIGILHQNEDSSNYSKARGHIGSLLEQKVVSSIAISDTKYNFKIQTTKLREGKPISLTAIFNESTEMLELQEATQTNIIPQLTFPATASELDKQIMSIKRQSENTAKKVRLKLEQEKLIIGTKSGRDTIYNKT